VPSKRKEVIEDVVALVGVSVPAAFLVRRAGRREGAFERAGKNTVAASVAGGIAGGLLGFVADKVENKGLDPLTNTAIGSGFGALCAGGVACFTSLASDALFPKKRRRSK